MDEIKLTITLQATVQTHDWRHAPDAARTARQLAERAIRTAMVRVVKDDRVDEGLIWAGHVQAELVEQGFGHFCLGESHRLFSYSCIQARAQLCAHRGDNLVRLFIRKSAR